MNAELIALAERLEEVERAERDVSLGMDMDPLRTANHRYAETCKEAAAMLRKMAEKKPVAWAVKWKTGGGLSFLTEDYPTGMYVGADDEQYAVPLYAAPVPAITAEQKAEARRLRDWATTYLSTGGLFNPELAQHRVVSDLILECRDYLDKIGGQG